MVNIVVKGLPRKMKYAKLLSVVRKKVKFGFVRQLHCKPISKTTKISIFSMKSDDARKFRRALDGFVLEHNGVNYPLRCWSTNKNKSEETDMPNDKNHNAVDDIRAIDLKIESVRKQRILIEEEVKLRLKQQKLSLQISGKLSDDENNTEQLAEPVNPTVMAAKPEPDEEFFKIKLPPLIAVLKAILSDMRELIKKHMNDQNKNVITYMVRAAVKRRLKENLRGKVYLMPEESISLYRSEYPKSTDEALVLEVVSTYRSRKGDNIVTESAEDGKMRSVVDLDEVADVVDMENDLDDWTEETERFKLSDDKNNTEQLAELVNPTLMAVKPEPNEEIVKRKLPPLIAVLKAILSEMQDVITKHINDQNRKVIRYMVRTAVKKRLRENHRGKMYLTPEELINLYRSEYPKSTDVLLVLEVASRVRPSTGHNIVTVSSAGDVKMRYVVDPDEVADVVDMENDLDDWTEDTEKTEIKVENGVAIKEEANDVLAVAEDVKVLKDEAHKEVKEEVEVPKEDTVDEDEDVTFVDDNKVDGDVIIVDED